MKIELVVIPFSFLVLKNNRDSVSELAKVLFHPGGGDPNSNLV
jgi:hypothetical protein